jgi:hypothetical protein
MSFGSGICQAGLNSGTGICIIKLDEDMSSDSGILKLYEEVGSGIGIYDAGIKI